MVNISNNENMIDVRDLIEEFELSPGHQDHRGEQARQTIAPLLDELKGKGGDYMWLGDWYPVTLVRDSYFREYAQELAEDIGVIDVSGAWPSYCIDWDRASRYLQVDYTSVNYNGATYWYR